MRGQDIREVLWREPRMMLGGAPIATTPPLQTAIMNNFNTDLFSFMSEALVHGLISRNGPFRFEPNRYLTCLRNGRVLSACPSYVESVNVLVRTSLPHIGSLDMSGIPLEGSLFVHLSLILNATNLRGLSLSINDDEDEEYDTVMPRGIEDLPGASNPLFQNKMRHQYFLHLLQDQLVSETNRLREISLCLVPPTACSFYMETFVTILKSNHRITLLQIYSTLGVEVVEQDKNDVDNSDKLRRDQVQYNIALNRNGRSAARGNFWVSLCQHLADTAETDVDDFMGDMADVRKWNLSFGLLMENPSAWSRRIWTEKTGEKRKIELLNL